MGSSQCRQLLQNDFQELCNSVKKDDLSLGIFYPVLWSSNRHAALVYIFRKISKPYTKAITVFLNCLWLCQGNCVSFYAVNTKKNYIEKQMLPVVRKDKVELTLKAGGPQRWWGVCWNSGGSNVIFYICSFSLQVSSFQHELKNRKHMLSISSYQLRTLFQCTTSSESAHPAPLG